MATLTYSDLLKRNNVEVLINRIDGGVIQITDNKSPLLKCSGKVKLTMAGAVTVFNKYNEESLRMFLTTRQGADKLEVEAEGRFYSITKIYKDKVFGGSGTGSGTAKEDAQLASLQQQILNAIIESGTNYIEVKVKNKKHKVIGAESTPGTPKSDFHLLDLSKKECVWISHKDGKTAKDFQQWGGVSKKEYSKTPKEVCEFVSKINSLFNGKMPSAMTIATKIKDSHLKNTAVYGVDYGKNLGRQNVSMLLQGDVKLVKKSGHYEIEAHHTHYNGDKITGDFEPVLMAIYKGDRDNFGIKGARFGISPIKSRAVKKWL